MGTIWSQVLLPSLSQIPSAQGTGDLGGHLDSQKFALLLIETCLPSYHILTCASGCKYG